MKYIRNGPKSQLQNRTRKWTLNLKAPKLEVDYNPIIQPTKTPVPVS